MEGDGMHPQPRSIEKSVAAPRSPCGIHPTCRGVVQGEVRLAGWLRFSAKTVMTSGSGKVRRPCANLNLGRIQRTKPLDVNANLNGLDRKALRHHERHVDRCWSVNDRPL